MGGFEAGRHLRVRVELGHSGPQGPDLPSIKAPCACSGLQWAS